MFASALAIGILLDATIVRALIVPAVVAALGRRAWWMPPWATALLRIRAQAAPASAVSPDASRRS
jgi:putative drug exporter of the RND superfamily